jgi:hypothetical protein
VFDRPIPRRNPSRDEILAELTLGSPGLSATSTLVEWDDECEIIPDVPVESLFVVEELRRVLERWFGIAIPVDEAKNVLAPLKERTLGELASYIVARAEFVVPVPMRVAGEASLEAGLFAALRGALSRRGVPSSKIRPMTSLARLLEKNPNALRGAFREVAPAHATEMAWRHPRLAKAFWLLATGGMCLTFASRWVGGASLVGFPAAVVGLVGGLIASGRVLVHGQARYETVADWCRGAASGLGEHG